MSIVANIKSQIKDIRQNEVRRQRNMSVSSEMKTRTKQALANANTKEADQYLRQALKAIDRAVNRGIIHKNTGARKKSLLVKTLNSQKNS